MAITLSHPLPGAAATGGFRWRPAFTENGVHVPAMLHNGADFGAPAGTPIRAAHAGKITLIDWDGPGGWSVMITASFGRTYYAHMREKSTDVRVGQNVVAGQIIGRVGMTGTATGNHLHFMLDLGRGWIDPMPYIHTTPSPQPTPGQEEDEDMATKPLGRYIGGDKTTPAEDRMCVIYYPDSGYYELWSGTSQEYINEQAGAHRTGNFTRITSKMWEQAVRPNLEKLLTA